MTNVAPIYSQAYQIPEGKIYYVNPVQFQQDDELAKEISGNKRQKENTNGCTDGKDDGKIGFFSKIGHAIKGGVKAIGQGIKSMFTDKDGKFSLGKTLLSIGLAVAAIYCAPVALALGAMGVVHGAKGIAKGAAQASAATTDAEAKQAWENIGGGATTVAISAYAMKGAYGAMKSTSTAGANGGSALNELGEGASLGAKTKAFWADAKSSTVNGINSFKTSVSSAVEDAATINGKPSKMSELGADATRTQKAKAFAEDVAQATENTVKSAAKTVKDSRLVQDPKGLLKDAGQKVRNSNIVKNPTQTIKNGLANLKKVKLSDIKAGLTRAQEQAYQTLVDEGYFAALQKHGYDTVLPVLAAVAAQGMDE